ncbi:caspase domain-containing protein [Schizophyllum amplum]|uniref:Caspase domain-containing protein n=1 Tax=Schizophyllum amplum TaxID=97359 RepID=A0A550C701_9AGAR|nr:caspase domain-containing protein [Auriculariopsis ampla]
MKLFRKKNKNSDDVVQLDAPRILPVRQYTSILNAKSWIPRGRSSQAVPQMPEVPYIPSAHTPSVIQPSVAQTSHQIPRKPVIVAQSSDGSSYDARVPPPRSVYDNNGTQILMHNPASPSHYQESPMMQSPTVVQGNPNVVVLPAPDPEPEEHHHSRSHDRHRHSNDRHRSDLGHRSSDRDRDRERRRHHSESYPRDDKRREHRDEDYRRDDRRHRHRSDDYRKHRDDDERKRRDDDYKRDRRHTHRDDKYNEDKRRRDRDRDRDREHRGHRDRSEHHNKLHKKHRPTTSEGQEPQHHDDEYQQSNGHGSGGYPADEYGHGREDDQGGNGEGYAQSEDSIGGFHRGVDIVEQRIIDKFRARGLPLPIFPHQIYKESSCTGRKRAVCIGIDYAGSSNELKGCINDARDVREFLVNTFRFKKENILLLTDDRSTSSRSYPSRANMISAMKWLVEGAKMHDSLFFHYSGHGGQKRSFNDDEADGYDETIFPADHEEAGAIIDDEMHKLMVDPLPSACRLTALFDSCHSGTVLDLPYIYSQHGRLRGSHVSPRARLRQGSPADVITWSACKDGQTSVDTFIGGEAVGAMSYAFVKILRSEQDLSYGQLLRKLRHTLGPEFNQTPQLGSSHPIVTARDFRL